MVGGCQWICVTTASISSWVTTSTTRLGFRNLIFIVLEVAVELAGSPYAGAVAGWLQ